MGLLLVVYGSWQVFRWIPGDQSLVGDAFFFPAGLAAIWAAWRASRRCAGWRRLQTAWRLLALASLAYLGGNIAQTLYELAGRRPYPSAADVFYVIFYPLMLAGILWFPRARRTRAESVRLALDAIVVAIAGAAVVGYAVFGPSAAAPASGLQTAFSIAYPVGDLIVIVGLVSMLRHAVPSARGALRLVTAGLLFFVVADVVYAYVTLHSSYQGGDPVDTLWMVAIACLALAGAAQGRVDAPERAPVVATGIGDVWVLYGAAGIGFAVLLVSQHGDSFFPDMVMDIGAVVLALLLAARQLLAQRDLIRSQGQLRHHALHDALTGLPNRALVFDRAEQMLARARREPSSPAALFIDIDGFKDVNDTLGHASGDAVLKAVAARLSSLVRACDTVGRLSGDEFVVLLDSPTVSVSPELVAERILDVVSRPIGLHRTEERSVSITVSIGVAVGQMDTVEELLQDADIALLEAKQAGKNRYSVFEATMQAITQDRVALETDIREALDGQQFFLLYQPTFDLSREAMTGVEALIRWRHPTRGVLRPGLFVPIAEQNGLIVPIGRWVLETACAQAAEWQRHGRRFGVAVNVSARQLESDDFVDAVRSALGASALEPSALTLEITETTLMRDAEAAAVRLHALKTLGVRLAIDDFGTGYSSLAYLRQFPVDAIKIDRSFVSGIAASTASTALVHTLVQLGQTLGLETVGEGIENRVQLQTLQRAHCDLGQGFLFARPVPAEAIEQFFDQVMPAETLILAG